MKKNNFDIPFIGLEAATRELTKTKDQLHELLISSIVKEINKYGRGMEFIFGNRPTVKISFVSYAVSYEVTSVLEGIDSVILTMVQKDDYSVERELINIRELDIYCLKNIYDAIIEHTTNEIVFTAKKENGFYNFSPIEDSISEVCCEQIDGLLRNGGDINFDGKESIVVDGKIHNIGMIKHNSTTETMVTIMDDHCDYHKTLGEFIVSDLIHLYKIIHKHSLAKK